MEGNKNIAIENEFFLAKWMEGTISEKELINLVSEEDFNVYKKIKRGILVFEELEKPLASSYAAVQNRINHKKKEKIKKQNIRWGVSIAASLLILFGLFTTFSNQEVVIETSVAEQKTVFLLDGSEAILNAKSKISYHRNDWENQREINLKGEAFFKVKKGSTFTVHTEYGNVEVLGTQFNVNNTNDYFEVTCFEGKVKVTNNASDYILKPGNSFRRINGNNIENFSATANFPTWINGESSFKSVPLKYVIIALEKQYNIEIDASRIDESLIFTGSFSHKKLEIALASVFKTMKIKYQKKEKGIFILE